jgi:hypothetical protein
MAASKAVIPSLQHIEFFKMYTGPKQIPIPGLQAEAKTEAVPCLPASYS